MIDRVLKRSNNAPYDYVGSTKQMGKVPAMAALLDCSEERIARVRDFAGIHHDVFASEDQVRQLLDKRHAEADRVAIAQAEAEGTSVVSAQQLMDYCREQLDAARTEEERAAARRLVAVLLDNTDRPGLRLAV